jgi:hypothetical protein
MTPPGPASVDERLLELCPVVLFRQRPDLSFECISPRIHEWTGVSPEEWLRNAGFLQQLIHPPDAGAYTRHVEQAQKASGEGQVQFRIRHRDTGRLTALTETRRAIPGPRGNAGFEGSWTQIPPDYFEAPWRDTYNALAIGASHEFNNKLTAIVSLSDLFMGDVGPAHPMAAGLRTMRSTAYGISEVLHQLAAHYFGETGRRELVDLNTTVRSVAALLRRCVSSRIEIECNLHPGPLPVTVDAVWLQRVLLMLAVLAAARTVEAATLAFKTSGGSHAAVTLESRHFTDQPVVARGDREVYAFREAARFAAAHAGGFEEAGERITVAVPIVDLDAPLPKNSGA